MVLRPDCYKLHPILKKLSEKEILFLALAIDYHSIYRQFPEQDRIRRAMFHVYDDYMPNLLKEDRIKQAIEAYKGLQYDPNIEQVRMFQKKIDSLLQKIDTDDSPSSNKTSLDLISKLRKEIRDIEAEIVETMQNKGQIKGNKTLSFIEILTSNDKLYQSVKTTKPKKQMIDQEEDE